MVISAYKNKGNLLKKEYFLVIMGKSLVEINSLNISCYDRSFIFNICIKCCYYTKQKKYNSFHYVIIQKILTSILSVCFSLAVHGWKELLSASSWLKKCFSSSRTRVSCKQEINMKPIKTIFQKIIKNIWNQLIF